MKTESNETAVNIKQLKEFAAISAVDFVRSGMVIGLGHGSTTDFAVRHLGKLIENGELQDILAVPCSRASGLKAMDAGIPLTTLEENPTVDLTIDGADEVDPQMNLIKGRGGALLRERIVAQVCTREIIIVDETKVSPVIGTKCPVPVEVIPFGWTSQAIFLEQLGARVALRKKKDGEVFTTEEGNFIIDCRFGPLDRPHDTADMLSRRAGIVAHGIWLGVATDIIIAGKKGLRHLKRQ